MLVSLWKITNKSVVLLSWNYYRLCGKYSKCMYSFNSFILFSSCLFPLFLFSYWIFYIWITLFCMCQLSIHFLNDNCMMYLFFLSLVWITCWLVNSDYSRIKFRFFYYRFISIVLKEFIREDNGFKTVCLFLYCL